MQASRESVWKIATYFTHSLSLSLIYYLSTAYISNAEEVEVEIRKHQPLVDRDGLSLSFKLLTAKKKGNTGVIKSNLRKR